jgi:uncharacterized protein YbjT (DUF2867 family)
MLHNDHVTAIIAGASGLVGSHLISMLSESNNIDKVYALCRSPLSPSLDKVETIMDGGLRVTHWDDDKPAPDIGFICLGTTRKQAGSKAALEKVDYDLVCDVAKTMKMLGVKRIAVVSSLGASSRSLSHYLRCKGKAEERISQLGFDTVVFARPGPLAGRKKLIRSDEVMLQKIMSVFKPLMIGPLENYLPIPAENVAKSMLFSLFLPQNQAVSALDSKQMSALLKQYD